MKNLNILFLLFFLSFKLNAQEKKHIVYINDDMFVMLNFPSKIEFNQISASTEEMLGIKTEGENLFIQSLVTELPKSNIMVKTEDGNYYSIILEYKTDLEELNKFYKTSDAVNSNSINSNVVPLTKPTFETKQEKKGQKNQEPKNESKENLSVIEKVYQDNGFIKSRNATEKLAIRLTLKGIYINNDKLYFLFSIRNKSNISYSIQSFLFSEDNKKSKKNVSGQIVDMTPIEIKNNLKVLDVGKEENIVFVFDKFTIDDNKQFKIEMYEEQGQRNLSFIITSDIINSAKMIK